MLVIKIYTNICLTNRVHALERAEVKKFKEETVTESRPVSLFNIRLTMKTSL